jgi:hypothetical protein
MVIRTLKRIIDDRVWKIVTVQSGLKNIVS